MDAAPQASDFLQQIIKTIDDNTILSGEQRNRYLDALEAYECWVPFFRLIKRSIDDPKKRTLADYVRLAKVQNFYLEDVFAASETCAQLVDDLRLSYQTLRDQVLPLVVAEDDYAAEAMILQGIYPALPSTEDRIDCLERLCLIYEKRKYDEVLLNESYEKLISIDPRNQKALRYFKVLFTQNNDWEEVARILQTLHGDAKHRNDAYRIAQELATVYLYQLGEPKKAVDVLERDCADSPLDTSTVHFDAYYRLQDWDGCLRVLRDCLSRVDSDFSRAILFFKIGELEQQVGRHDRAEESYLKASQLAPRFLEPLENLIDLSLDAKNWGKTLRLLEILQGLVHDDYLKERVGEAITRLHDGMGNAQS